MHPLLESFAATAHQALKSNPGPKGREQVCEALSVLLKDEAFLRDCVDQFTEERNKVFEDPELGFCVLVHHYAGAKSSSPHDHAHSWAIYGQARGETLMTDYSLVSPPAGDQPGKVKPTKSYSLKPGDVHLYNEGVLHAPERVDSTRLIRIEGVDMKTVKRAAFEVV
jgi:hypothetical protein